MRLTAIFITLLLFTVAKAETLPCDTNVDVPSVFTPNTDGVAQPLNRDFNDSLPYEYSFIIYNRWATVVFEAANREDAWNGRYYNKGNPLEDGTYYYILRYNYSKCTPLRECRGTIQCIMLDKMPAWGLDTVQEEYNFPYLRPTICPGCCSDDLQEFKPLFLFPPVSFRMWIFDRWGNVMHETSDYTKGWDGRHDGLALKEDTYVYKIKVVRQPGEKEEEFVGTINLIR